MPEPTLPFIHINLRRNPFGELTPEERGRLARVVPEAARHHDWLRAQEAPAALQITGDAGHGKSTHLHALRVLHHADAPYIYLAEGERRLRFPRAPVVFLDEAQRIPGWRRRLLFRRRSRWVIATHEDLRDELAAAGVSVRALHLEQGQDLEHVHALLERRVEAARRDPDRPRSVIGRDCARALVARYGSNLRAIEAHLYDVFQNLQEIGYVTL